MKLKYLSKVTVAISLIFILSVGQVYAATDTSLQNSCATALSKLGILNKDGKGGLRLNDKVKRCEFIALVNRTMSYDLNSDAAAVKITFKDISSRHWAYTDIKVAVKHNLIHAYDGNTIKPDNVITNTEALEILLKALGYEKAIQGGQSDVILKKAAELGVSLNAVFPADAQITRGEASIIIYNALTVNFAG